MWLDKAHFRGTQSDQSLCCMHKASTVPKLSTKHTTDGSYYTEQTISSDTGRNLIWLK